MTGRSFSFAVSDEPNLYKVKELKDKGLGATEITKRLKIGRASVYRMLGQPSIAQSPRQGQEFSGTSVGLTGSGIVYVGSSILMNEFNLAEIADDLYPPIPRR